MSAEMTPEQKKVVPEEVLPGTQGDDGVPEAATEAVREALKISVRDRVVIALTLMVALGLCILLGTVLRVPGT